MEPDGSGVDGRQIFLDLQPGLGLLLLGWKVPEGFPWFLIGSSGFPSVPDEFLRVSDGSPGFLMGFPGFLMGSSVFPRVPDEFLRVPDGSPGFLMGSSGFSRVPDEFPRVPDGFLRVSQES